MNNVFADFIKDKGLYDEVTISPENIKDLIALVKGQVKLDCYCKECGEKRIFSMNPIPCIRQTGPEKYEIDDLGEYLSRVQAFHSQASRPSPVGSGDFLGSNKITWFWTKRECYEDTRIIAFRYICTWNDDHRIDYIIQTDGNVLRKIGQYPSKADLAFPELDNYRSVIDECDRKELGRAIGLFAQGIGIGSYVYLRRIFERILEKAREQANTDGAIDDEAYRKARVAEKIPMLKDYLPEMMVKNAQIYGIISKGMHELSEENCISYFPIMKDGIFMILRQWEQKRKDKVAEDELQAAISKIGSSL